MKNTVLTQLDSYPEYISFGNNVWVASEVAFVNHDIVNDMLNIYNQDLKLSILSRPIEIGDNVMIGSRVMIMPNVKIGNNVIIAAGAIVSKDIPDNSVAGGIPAKVIGSFEDLVKKRIAQRDTFNWGIDKLWDEFYKQRGK